jgi:hypothetical protein
VNGQCKRHARKHGPFQAWGRITNPAARPQGPISLPSADRQHACMKIINRLILLSALVLPLSGADSNSEPVFSFGDQTVVVSHRVQLGQQTVERRVVMKSATIKTLSGRQYLVGQGVHGWKENALVIIPAEGITGLVCFKDASKVAKLMADKEEKFEMADLP